MVQGGTSLLYPAQNRIRSISSWLMRRSRASGFSGRFTSFIGFDFSQRHSLTAILHAPERRFHSRSTEAGDTTDKRRSRHSAKWLWLMTWILTEAIGSGGEWLSSRPLMILFILSVSQRDPRLPIETSSRYFSSNWPKVLSGMLPRAPAFISASLLVAHASASFFLGNVAESYTPFKRTMARQASPLFWIVAILGSLGTVFGARMVQWSG